MVLTKPEDHCEHKYTTAFISITKVIFIQVESSTVYTTIRQSIGNECIALVPSVEENH